MPSTHAVHSPKATATPCHAVCALPKEVDSLNPSEVPDGVVCFQSIMEYNGAAVIGMVGKDCVGIASDSRYGIQQMTVGANMQKIFKV